MKKYILFISGIALPVLISHAQNNKLLQTIPGRVISAKTGKPMAGTTIILKSSGFTTIANEAGEFTIKLSLPSDTLIARQVGYQTQRIFLSREQNSSLIIRLRKSAAQLQEVVVSTGYQQIPKARATGSFEQIDNDLLNQQVGPNITDRLEGVTNGLSMDHKRASPYSTGIMVRGLSTINGPREPLIILDNFPYQGNIANINPNDVESVTILKDAAAASIWGARAGNGVIVITTKRGKYNEPFSLSLNANITVTSKPNLFYLPQISSSDFIDIEKMLFSKGFYNGKENNRYNRAALTPVVELLIAARDGQLSISEANKKINMLRNTDVRNDFNKYVYQNAVNKQYSINIHGGSNKLSYFLSGGLDNITDNLDAGHDRLSFNAKTSIRPFNRLEISTGITYTQSKNTSGRPSYQSFNQIYPYARLADKSGNPLPLAKYRDAYIDTAGEGLLLDWHYYPLEDYKHNKSRNKLNDFLANIGLNYAIMDGLNIGIKYEYERQVTANKTLHDPESFYTRDMINTFSQIDYALGRVTYNIPKGSILDLSNGLTESYDIRGQLSYTKLWGRNNISAIIGNEMRQSEINNSNSRFYGYNEDILTTGHVDYAGYYLSFISGFPLFIPNNDFFGETINRFVSVYGNMAYTYNNKYTLSLSGRRDASNLFGVSTNNKWTPLWSAGAAWDISNESFYHFQPLPYLKLRTTFGYSGNSDQSQSAVTTIRYITQSPYTGSPYAAFSRYANPDLRWEKIAMLNIGLDFASKNRRVEGSLDFYSKNGTDLYGTSAIDYTTGIGNSIVKNVADMTGHGWDLKLNTLNIASSIRWSSSIILNYNRDKITKYFSGSTQASNFIYDANTYAFNPLEGKPVLSILSYKWAGLDPSTGDPQGYLNKQVSKDYSDILNAPVESLVYNGSAIPTLYGSFRNTITWKAFSLTANIIYKLGYCFRRGSINYSNLFALNQGHSDYAERWQKPGDEKLTSVPSLIYPNLSNRDAFYSGSEVLVDKGGNIRIQYINVSYQLQEGKSRRLPFKQIKLYLNVSNIGIIWRANADQLDPDYLAGTIPPSTGVAIGIKANF